MAAPVTHEVLAGLVPGLGDVNFLPVMATPQRSLIPPRKNAFDFQISGAIPMEVPYWESPKKTEQLLLVVDTRLSAVLGMVFQQGDWAEKTLTAFMAVAALFSGGRDRLPDRGHPPQPHDHGRGARAVRGHAARQGSRLLLSHSGEGERPACELSQSFNTMTENLGKLIVVAKEKERLESELAIAREVQNQLFPKDVPVHADAGAERRVQSRAHGVGRLLRFYGVERELAGLRDRRCGGQGNLGGAADGDDPVDDADAARAAPMAPGRCTSRPRSWCRI